MNRNINFIKGATNLASKDFDYDLDIQLSHIKQVHESNQNKVDPLSIQNYWQNNKSLYELNNTNMDSFEERKEIGLNQSLMSSVMQDNYFDALA